MNRRSFLAAGAACTAGVTALAGCVGGASPAEAADPWLARDSVADGIRGRLLLRRGEFFAHRFTLSSPGHLRLRVRERLSLPIDCMTFQEETEMERYRAGEPVDPVNTYSLLGVTRGQFDRRIPDGSYAFVVDNTRLGAARPFDEIDVGIDLRIER